MSSQPPSSALPPSMGPGARPMQPGESPGSLLKELSDIRASYMINVDSDALRLAYNFKGQNRKYDIPFTSMPVSDFSRWLLYGGPARARVVGLFTLDLIRGSENMAGRPLTQTEAEGFALHTGKRMKYNFLGTAAGFAAGYLIAARTWKTMKFPFMKPKPIESYEYFPAQRMPILQGAYSRLMWQITRANMYAAISLIVCQTLMGSMGDSVMAVGLYRDTRTQGVVNAMKGNFDRIRMNRSQPGQAAPLPQQQHGYDQDPQNPDFYGNEGRDPSDQYARSSDHSGGQNFFDSTTDTGLLDDSTMKQRDRQRESRAPHYSPAPQPTSSPRSRKSSSDFFFDDASPTAGTDPDMAQSRPSQSGGGSVWDRIRRGGSSQRPAQQETMHTEEPTNPTPQTGGWRTRSGQDYSTQGDGFSFSNSEEERQLAKIQAQREFDAMLERERREGGSEAYTSGSFAAESGSENAQQSTGSAWGRRRGGGS